MTTRDKAIRKARRQLLAIGETPRLSSFVTPGGLRRIAERAERLSGLVATSVTVSEGPEPLEAAPKKRGRRPGQGVKNVGDGSHRFRHADPAQFGPFTKKIMVTSKRYKILEAVSQGMVCPEEIAAKIGCSVENVFSQCFCLKRDMGIGYHLEGNVLSILYPRREDGTQLTIEDVTARTWAELGVTRVYKKIGTKAKKRKRNVKSKKAIRKDKESNRGNRP